MRCFIVVNESHYHAPSRERGKEEYFKLQVTSIRNTVPIRKIKSKHVQIRNNPSQTNGVSLCVIRRPPSSSDCPLY